MNTSTKTFKNFRLRQVVSNKDVTGGRLGWSRDGFSCVRRFSQPSYPTTDWNSSGLRLRTDELAPKDMVFSFVQLWPREVDPYKIYSMTTEITYTDENGTRYKIVDVVTWKEPYRGFEAVGAPYIGSKALTFREFWSLHRDYWRHGYRYYDAPH
jgi:hypothetical protein